MKAPSRAAPRTGRAMATKGESSAVEQAYAAAARRFPQAKFAIRMLMNRSETFCDMCEELADAEFALSQVPGVPAALREARRVEWQELIDRLVAEVGTAISECRTGQAPGSR
jgi:hypothetical protein